VRLARVQRLTRRGVDVAMQQAGHGAASDIADQGIANPDGMIASSAMLLRWLSARHDDERLFAAAGRADAALSASLMTGVRTSDVGGTAGTDEFVAAELAATADAA